MEEDGGEKEEEGEEEEEEEGWFRLAFGTCSCEENKRSLIRLKAERQTQTH